MKLSKKALAWIISIIIIIAFLFPKPAGKIGGKLPPPEAEYKRIDKECSCLGYKFVANPRVMDAPHYYLCVGIPYSCKCVQHTFNRETGEKISEETAC
ncbi:hypothetical protein KY343_06155 [Candidatus Woesearchaeota archaeon]|nr:hypothetical protein [Candidatus Woesearchaeota archaeon]